MALARGEPPDGPKRIVRDDFIENLVAQWNLTREIRAKLVQNKLETTWVLNHQFLQLHMKDVADPPAYLDPAAKGWTFLMENGDKSGKRVFFAKDSLRRP